MSVGVVHCFARHRLKKKRSLELLPFEQICTHLSFTERLRLSEQVGEFRTAVAVRVSGRWEHIAPLRPPGSCENVKMTVLLVSESA